jgi:hypothetical protein
MIRRLIILLLIVGCEEAGITSNGLTDGTAATDTLYVFNYDTLIVTNYDTTIFNNYDTTIVINYDTTIVYDTLVVVDTVYIDSDDVYGCTDATACNFNADANIFDNSCWFASEGCDCDDPSGSVIDCLGICDADAYNNPPEDSDGTCCTSVEIISTNMEGDRSKNSNIYFSFSKSIDISQFYILEKYDSLYFLNQLSDVFSYGQFWYDNNTNTISFINQVTTLPYPDGTGEGGFSGNDFTISDLKFSDGCTLSKTFYSESNEHNFNIVPNPSSDNTIRFTHLLESCNISIFKNYPDTLITINHNNPYDGNEFWTNSSGNGIYIYTIHLDIYDSFGDFLSTEIFNQGSIIIYSY